MFPFPHWISHCPLPTIHSHFLCFGNSLFASDIPNWWPWGVGTVSAFQFAHSKFPSQASLTFQCFPSLLLLLLSGCEQDWVASQPWHVLTPKIVICYLNGCQLLLQKFTNWIINWKLEEHWGRRRLSSELFKMIVNWESVVALYIWKDK